MDAVNAQKALFETLKGARVGPDQNYTHNAQVAPKGKFFVTAQNLRSFFDQLCTLISVDGHSGLMEKYEPRMPIIVDNDFDFEPTAETGENPPVMYPDWMVLEQIKAYQEAMRQYLDIKDPRAFICCVFEKPGGYIKKGKVHNGFHLQFPFCVMEADDQQSALAPRVRNLLKTRGLLERLASEGIKESKAGGWDEILDPGLPKKTWVMYGCRKDNNMAPYRLTAIYDGNLNQLSVADTFRVEELTFVKQNLIPLSFFKEHPLEYYLPVLLSVRAWDCFVPVKDEIKAILPSMAERKKRAPKPPPKVGGETKADARLRLKEVREVMEMLSSTRANAYETWMQVGWCLYTMMYGSTEGLELWIEFSRRSTKFEEGKCDELWAQMTAGNWTMGSLRYWASQDSPEAYREWRKTEEGTLMLKALSTTHYDVAKLVHKMFETRYVCASLRHGLWYEFRDHRWCVTDKGTALYGRLSTEVVAQFDRLRTEVSMAIERASDDIEKERLNEQIKRIGKVTEKLKDTTYKNKIMTELATLFFSSSFLELLDRDKDLTVWTNGVLDLKLKVLRPGVPEDYCSRTTRIPFPTNYTWDTREVKEVQEYLRKVFPTEGLRKYFLGFASSVLRGGNSSKALPQWYGEGDNSKSGITELFVRALGEYCIKFPTTFFTGKSAQSGAATPETTRVPGARIGFIQEPDGAEKLNISKVKEFTGGDSVYVRGLYAEGRDVEVSCKFVIVCNKPLQIPSNERALHGRLELLPFLATFCRDPRDVPETVEEQYAKHLFPADPFFADRIPSLAPAFAWVMWQEYPNIKANTESKPIEVVEATANYKKDSDAYTHFLSDKIEPRPGNKMTIAKMYRAFTAWFKVNFPSIVIPSRIEMRDSLNRIFKRPLVTESWVDIDIKAEEGVDLANLLVE